jgi:hypothetical protein
MKRRHVIGLGLVLMFMIAPSILAQLRFSEDEKKGTLTILDGPLPVMTYQYGDLLGNGVDPRYTRSCYLHPVYSLDGLVILTEDFPKDHLHHRGLFWTWPVAKTRGQDTQTWHPVDPSLRQHFVRWLERKVDRGVATLAMENAWKLAGREVVARERVKLGIHPASEAGRAIDIEIVLEALGGPLELRGAPDQNKGYGGLCLRGAPLFTGAVMTTDKGPLEKDVTNVPYRWADISTPVRGVAIFVSPDHPGFLLHWLIRNSYAGVLNPSWPGNKTTVLEPGSPVSLLYRIYIHRGDAVSGRVEQAYSAYVSR